MKKIIIVAICIVAVWGCSDDKVTKPKDKDNSPLVGGISFYDRYLNLDTLGDISENETVCEFNENHNRLLRYDILQGAFEIIIPDYETKDMGFELETAEPTALLKEDFKKHFGGDIPKHNNYAKYTYSWKDLPIRQGYYLIDTTNL
ncbi:hypothetical protein EP342_02905, partial [bacterium]